ncbi:unnamed protein product [Victoria cruziana]
MRQLPLIDSETLQKQKKKGDFRHAQDRTGKISPKIFPESASATCRGWQQCPLSRNSHGYSITVLHFLARDVIGFWLRSSQILARSQAENNRRKGSLIFGDRASIQFDRCKRENYAAEKKGFHAAQLK